MLLTSPAKRATNASCDTAKFLDPAQPEGTRKLLHMETSSLVCGNEEPPERLIANCRQVLPQARLAAACSSTSQIHGLVMAFCPEVVGTVVYAASGAHTVLLPTGFEVSAPSLEHKSVAMLCTRLLPKRLLGTHRIRKRSLVAFKGSLVYQLRGHWALTWTGLQSTRVWTALKTR